MSMEKSGLIVIGQRATGTGEITIPVHGVKRLLCTAGGVAVVVYFSFHKGGGKDTDGYTIPINTTYKFEAPEGKKFMSVIASSAAASTISIVAMDMDVKATW